MNTIQRLLWWLLAILAAAVAVTYCPDLDRACDREPSKCSIPAHNHSQP